MKAWDCPPDLPMDENRPPADKHTSFLFEAELVGGHVHVKVRAATRGHSVQVDHSRALCGSLIMWPEEWFLLRQVLERAETPDPQWVDDEHGHVFRIAGAGCFDLVGFEHTNQRFIEIQEAT